MTLGFFVLRDSLSCGDSSSLHQSDKTPPHDPIETLIVKGHFPPLLCDIERRIERCIKESVPPFARNDRRKLKNQITFESIENEKEIRILPLKLQLHGNRLRMP